MIRKFFNALQGRHTALAIFFTLMGTALAWCHKLEMPYVALVTAIQGWVFAHSFKEDHFDQHDHDDHKGVS
jgi:hypothetical protein